MSAKTTGLTSGRRRTRSIVTRNHTATLSSTYDDSRFTCRRLGGRDTSTVSTDLDTEPDLGKRPATVRLPVPVWRCRPERSAPHHRATPRRSPPTARTITTGGKPVAMRHHPRTRRTRRWRCGCRGAPPGALSTIWGPERHPDRHAVRAHPFGGSGHTNRHPDRADDRPRVNAVPGTITTSIVRGSGGGSSSGRCTVLPCSRHQHDERCRLPARRGSSRTPSPRSPPPTAGSARTRFPQSMRTLLSVRQGTPECSHHESQRPLAISRSGRRPRRQRKAARGARPLP